MAKYKCEKCNKVFKRNENLKYHISKDACKKDKFFCKYCNNGFTTVNSMYRHMKHSCKIRKQEEEKKLDILNRLILLEEKI